jgi:hypothetical protein
MRMLHTLYAAAAKTDEAILQLVHVVFDVREHSLSLIKLLLLSSINL